MNGSPIAAERYLGHCIHVHDGCEMATGGSAALAAFEAAPERFDVAVVDELVPGLAGTIGRPY